MTIEGIFSVLISVLIYETASDFETIRKREKGIVPFFRWFL
jgi:hypothetical protein